MLPAPRQGQPYVGPPFVYDIFLSYGHGPSEDGTEPRLKRWSLAFSRELRSEIQTPEFDGKVAIFIDDSPRPSERLRPMGSIAEQLEFNCNAALLVTLVSPAYLASDWCAAERGWWSSHQSKLQRSPHASVYADQNVFVVHVWHCPSLPPEMKGSKDAPLGMRFYDPVSNARPYEWPEPTPASRDPFRTQLVALAGFIQARLADIREQQEARRQAQEAARRLLGEGRYVYLYGRVAYKDKWLDARTALTNAGFIVFPDQPEADPGNDPTRILKARDERVKTLRNCDAVLLVSPTDPQEVDADISAVGRDRLIALKGGTSHLPCALLDSVGASIATPSRKIRAMMMGVEWIDAAGDDWVARVHDWLVRVGETEAAQ